jgi:hypothetical protein
MSSSAAKIPAVIDRLRDIYGSYGKVCKALGVADSYPPTWRKSGCIPERWALDVHRLNVGDRWGHITAMTVLYECEDVRLRKIREIDEGG